MRTTITLPDDLHETLLSLSRDGRTTVSRTVEVLLRRALGGGESPPRPAGELSPVTGLPVLRLSRPVTADDVRALDDE